MNPELVQQLEEDCESALATAIEHYGMAGVTPRVLHLMAKAAVAVLEAVKETEQRVSGHREPQR